jgi:uncharacterized membrane protein YfcA
VNTLLAHVVVVVFVATLIRSVFGFGEALIAVPLLALRIPIQVAAPLAVLVSITIAAAVVAQDWRDIHVRSAGWLVLATLAGIPVGLWLLTRADERVVKVILGVTLVSFAAYSLRSRALWHLTTDKLSWLLGCGFVAGVFGGAYGMNGPPLVVYGSLRRWSAAHPANAIATRPRHHSPAAVAAGVVAAIATARTWHWGARHTARQCPSGYCSSARPCCLCLASRSLACWRGGSNACGASARRRLCREGNDDTGRRRGILDPAARADGRELGQRSGLALRRREQMNHWNVPRD